RPAEGPRRRRGPRDRRRAPGHPRAREVRPRRAPARRRALRAAAAPPRDARHRGRADRGRRVRRTLSAAPDIRGRGTLPYETRAIAPKAPRGQKRRGPERGPESGDQRVVAEMLPAPASVIRAGRRVTRRPLRWLGDSP